jgi:AraC-like DNA-binding protein
MAAVDIKSVDLGAGDDPEPGKLAETLHWIDFADRRKGRLHVSGMTVGAATLGDVLTDGYGARTTTGRVTVVLPMTGHVRMSAGGIAQHAAASDALLMQSGTRQSIMRPDRSGQSRTLTAIVPGLSREDEAHPRLPAIMPVGGAVEARSLRGFLVYVFSELRNAESPLRRPGMSSPIEAMVVDMVHGLCRNATPLPGPDAASAKHVRTALEFMRAHADEALTVERIARVVGLGPRSLQAAFRDALGSTPREALTEIRLENARARLETPLPCTTVTGAALDSGFTHLGRFAHAYRARFGESPSETLRRSCSSESFRRGLLPEQ